MSKPARYSERLKNGQRVASHVFTHMTGVVVDEPQPDNYHGYKVKVDEDIEHFSEFIYISPDEIITERDLAIEQAERRLETAKYKVQRTVKDLTWARENVREAKLEQQAAEAEQRAAKALPA